MMHIISGKYKRRRIEFPADRAFRPTKSRVREAVFSIIGSRIIDAAFLDLCSGSGAMGIEAESRGASSVVCVDKQCRFLQKNKQGMGAHIQIVQSDVLTFIQRNQQPFDIIFFDPVWADYQLYLSVIEPIMSGESLVAGGWLFVEHDGGMCDHLDHFFVGKRQQYQYGNTYISVIQKQVC